MTTPASGRTHSSPAAKPSCAYVLPAAPPLVAFVAAHAAWLTTVTTFSAATGPCAPVIHPSTTRRAPAFLDALPAPAHAAYLQHFVQDQPLQGRMCSLLAACLQLMHSGLTACKLVDLQGSQSVLIEPACCKLAQWRHGAPGDWSTCSGAMAAWPAGSVTAARLALRFSARPRPARLKPDAGSTAYPLSSGMACVADVALRAVLSGSQMEV